MDFLQASSADSSGASWCSFLSATKSLKKSIQLWVGEQLRGGHPAHPRASLVASGRQYRTSPSLDPDVELLTVTLVPHPRGSTSCLTSQGTSSSLPLSFPAPSSPSGFLPPHSLLAHLLPQKQLQALSSVRLQQGGGLCESVLAAPWRNT